MLKLTACRRCLGLGFTVAGGIDDQVFPGDTGVFITKIVEGGLAATDGRLALGDRIIAVSIIVQQAQWDVKPDYIICIYIIIIKPNNKINDSARTTEL